MPTSFRARAGRPPLPPAVQAVVDAAKKRPRRPPVVPKPRSTDIERALKLCLLALRVGHETEVKIGNYRVDFLLRDRMVVLEADGYWHTVRRIKARDKVRDEFLTGLGYKVVRLKYEDLMTDSMGCVRGALGL